MAMLIYGPTIDATGDDLSDACDKYGLELAERVPGTDGNRDILVYENNAKSFRLLATPYWSGSVGSTYIISVFGMQATH